MYGARAIWNTPWFLAIAPCAMGGDFSGKLKNRSRGSPNDSTTAALSSGVQSPTMHISQAEKSRWARTDRIARARTAERL